MASIEMEPQTETPKTQVLLTVGTNELPVVVAACRLAKKYHEEDGAWPGFTFIHSKQTGASTDIEPERECERIKERMEKELGFTFADDRVPLEDPYSPDKILSKVNEKLADLRRKNPALTKVCLAYTGGTKAMAVHAYEAVKAERWASEAYYLDPRQHRLLPKVAVTDERNEYAWGIEQLAQLHGFTTEFKAGKDMGGAEVRPTEPSPELLKLGRDMYEWYRQYQWYAGGRRQVQAATEKGRYNEDTDDDYNRWFAGWKHAWGAKGSREYRVYPQISTKLKRPPTLKWFNPDKANIGESWSELTDKIKDHFKAPAGWEERGQSYTLNIAKFPDAPLTGLCQFVKHQFLELKAYAELQAALEEVRYERGARVYHNVHLSRTGENCDLFSLDVVAVIGYQLFAVSCTASPNNIRQAGFEVLHRARQIGGDHALAMVLCPVSAQDACEIEDSLHDDIGVISVPLKVQSALDQRMRQLFRIFLMKSKVPFKQGALR